MHRAPVLAKLVCCVAWLHVQTTVARVRSMLAHTFNILMVMLPTLCRRDAAGSEAARYVSKLELVSGLSSAGSM